MSAIIQWIASLLGVLLPKLTEYFGKKFALGAVYVGVWLSIAGVFISFISGLSAGFSWLFPMASGPIQMLPSNLGASVSLILSAHAAAAIYDAQVNLLSLKSRV